MRCGGCGQENPERAKFCLECGKPLAAAAPEPVSRESRRVVTVVFADMVGFTSLGESLDQESLRRVMDRFYDGMRSAIEGESGTLAKFIGDAVLAVWGTPEVHEDDALRAVRAAEAMRGELATINEELESRWGVHVGMRTGVNTGEVVVDPTRPADLLVGDTLNVAARLEQAADDGVVLIGPETYRLVRDDCVLEPVEPLGLKGKARPMPAWRLVDGRGTERRADERLQAPLVGRADELATLRAAFDEAVAVRAARMVTVIGSPGLGKTRLVAEFVRSLGEGATVLHGRCQATGEGITFQPVAEVLRGAADITDDDSPEAALAKLRAVLPDEEQAAERAAGLLGLGPVATTEETFWAVRRILEALASKRPVVLVHDDIHWGQPTFLDLLEHFVAWISDAPVLVVGLARPELRELRPGLAADAIDLEPLDAAASRALVDGLLGATDLPPALAERVLETTEGNPLFLSEMLRMLADEGVLRREGDTWIAADVADVSVPPTIHALLAARIERLAAHERSVVERASVIGHQFYRGAVAELAPEPVRPLVDDALETLARKELVRPEDEWWLDERVFRFHHVLIRDAAYRTLLKEARADLHERFAEWLAAKAGDLAGEHEEVVAFHLEQAHGYRLELGPLDEAGRELASRAAARLHSAGRRALAREDLPAAANLLRRALAPLADDPPARLAVVLDLAEALLSAGDTAGAEQVVEELGLGADELGDDRLRAWAAVFACQLDNLTGAGHVRETADQAATAAEALAAQDDRAGEAKAWQVVAQAEAQLGQVAAAEAALDRALVAARAADDRRRITAVLSGAPRAALWGPAPIVRASGRCLDVVRILRMTPGNRHVEAAALRCQAVLEAMRGRADAARGILQTSRETLEELGLALELADTDVHAGIVELLAGRPAVAEERLRAAQTSLVALGVEGGAAQAAALLSRALLEQDRVSEALEATRFAEARGGEDLKTTATWLGVRAEALAREGEHDDARELAGRAVALTEPTDALPDKADALMALAATEALAGDAAAASAAAHRAQEHYAAKDHTVGLGRAEGLAPALPAASDVERPVEALRRQQELAADDRSGPPGARAIHRFFAAANAADVDELADLVDEDFEGIDHRPIGWAPTHGRQGVLNALRSWREAGEGAATVDRVLAADAEHVLAQVSYWMPAPSGGTSAGMTMLVLLEFRDGRQWRRELFGLDQEAAAVARYAEIAGTAPSVGPMEPSVLDAMAAAFNARDWERQHAVFADDYRHTVHRPIEAGTNDAQGFIAAMRHWVEIAPDLLITRVVVDERRGDVETGVFEGAGEADADGVVFHLYYGYVAKVRDGRLAAMDLFERDDVAGRREAFAEERADGSWLSRHALAKWLETYMRGDWDMLRRFYDPDVVVVDQRPGLRHEMRGAESVVAMFRQFASDQDSTGSWEVLIEAGDHVVAARSVTTGPDGAWELIADQLIVRDTTMRVVRIEIFGPEQADDLARRVDELAREPAPEGPRDDVTLMAWVEPSPETELMEKWVAAFNAHDLDALEALTLPGERTYDHRAGIRSTIEGAAGTMDVWRWLFAEVPDVAVRALVIQTAADALHVLIDYTSEQADYVIPAEMVVDRTGEGRIDMYEPDDPAAVARFAELAGDRQGEPQVAELERRWADAFNARDWDAAAALIWPGYVSEDRRALGAEPLVGPEGAVANARRMVEIAPDVTWTPRILEAGDRTALVLVTVQGGDFAVDVLNIAIVTADGLAYRHITFAPEQEAEARAEREAWAAHLRQAALQSEVLNAHDWDRAATELFAEDFVQHDHRAVGAPPISGGRAYAAHLRETFSLTPDMTAAVEVIAVRGDTRVTRVLYRGHSDTGGENELELWTVTRIDGLRHARSDLYATREDAMAAFAASHEHPMEVTFREHAAAIAAQDFDRLAELIADDYVWVSHQSGKREEGHGREVGLETRRQAIAVEGVANMVNEVEILETRGDRLGLTRAVWRGDFAGGPFEVAFHAVSEIDDQGRLRRDEAFDLHDLDRARARLDELAGRSNLATRHHFARAEAVARRDWEGMVDLFAPGAHYEDRRGALAHRLEGGGQAVADFWQRMVAGDSTTRLDVRPLAELGSDWAASLLVISGEGHRTGPWEVRIVELLVVDEEGRAVWAEMTEEMDAEQAAARLRELASAASWPTRSR